MAYDKVTADPRLIVAGREFELTQAEVDERNRITGGNFQFYQQNTDEEVNAAKAALAQIESAKAQATPPTAPVPVDFSTPIEIKDFKVTTVDVSGDQPNIGDLSGFGDGPTASTGFSLPTFDSISASVSSGYSTFQTGVSAVGTYVSDAASSAVDTFIPGIGDFSVTGAINKGEEMISSVVKGGIGGITGLFSGDKSGTVAKFATLTKNSATAALAEKAGATTKKENSLFVRVRSHQHQRDVVEFNVMPAIAESRDASYEEVGIVHHPGQILRYKSTGVRTWAVSAKLISRTPEEAAENLRILNLVRSWVMPYYGYGTAASYAKMLGAPPDILLLSAYGSKMIQEHPTVLTNYSTAYPNDIDYIDTAPVDGEVFPFPVILSLEIQLKEAWSPKEFSSFDLSEYKKGNLRNAFSGSLATFGGLATNTNDREDSVLESEKVSNITNASVPTAVKGEPTVSELAFLNNSLQKVKDAKDAIANNSEISRLTSKARVFKEVYDRTQELPGV